MFLTVNIYANSVAVNTKKLIYIKSDNQLLDMQNNMIIFTGKVTIIQETLKINADRVIIVNFYNKQDVIDGYGNPVTFYQVYNNKKPIKGKALQIHFELAKGYIILTGNAYLNQIGNSITSDKIVYSIKEQKVQAFGKKNQQVIMMVMPSKLQSLNNK